MQRAFWWERFLVHEFALTELGDVSLAPPVAGLEVHVIECEDDADRLAREGYEDFRLAIGASGRSLESGAVAFCAHVDRVLAHVAWEALDADAKWSFDTLPYAVDFANGEGCSGGSWTFRPFRNRGIYRHVLGARFQYLLDHGCRICRNAARVDNVAALRGKDRPGRRVCFVGHYRRALWWTDWKEVPVK